MRALSELEIRILDMIEPVAASLGLDIVRGGAIERCVVRRELARG